MDPWKPGVPNVTMRRVANQDELRKEGDFYFHTVRNGEQEPVTEHGAEQNIWISFRNNRNLLLSIPVCGPNAWKWNKDFDKPTIEPSILNWGSDAKGNRITHWHGYIRDGVVGFEC